MLIPYLVQILFITGAIGAIAVGVLDIKAHAIAEGILTILFGPVLIRMLCEYFIVLFKINDTLTDISQKLSPPQT